MPSDPKQVQALFLRLVELPRSDRQRLLDQECGSNPELRQRVDRLLAAHDESDSYLDKPSGEINVTIDSQALSAQSAARGEQPSKPDGAFDARSPSNAT